MEFVNLWKERFIYQSCLPVPSQKNKNPRNIRNRYTIFHSDMFPEIQRIGK